MKNRGGLLEQEENELKTVNTTPLEFSAIQLCLDDALPVNMVMLLGFEYDLRFDSFKLALEEALVFFPHFTGKVNLELSPLKVEVVSGKTGVAIENKIDTKSCIYDIRAYSQSELINRFAPTVAHKPMSFIETINSPLLSFRLTHLIKEETCVLGMFVSHMLVDGVGMKFFMDHLTSYFTKKLKPNVEHDRGYTFCIENKSGFEIPINYREIPNLPIADIDYQEKASYDDAHVFSIATSELVRCFNEEPLSESKLKLTAHVCKEIVNQKPDIKTLALWCNTRGHNGVSKQYTGNTGCYLHFDIENEDVEFIKNEFKLSGSRSGLRKAKSVYKDLKFSESIGKFVFWNGPREDLLSVNLVPQVKDATDFGKGPPCYGQLLTRNIHGLRVYTSPNGKELIFEVCLRNINIDDLLDSLKK